MLQSYALSVQARHPPPSQLAARSFVSYPRSGCNMLHEARNRCLVSVTLFAVFCLGWATLAEAQEDTPGTMADGDLSTLVESVVGEKPTLGCSKHFRIITTAEGVGLPDLLEYAEKVRTEIVTWLEMTGDPRCEGKVADFYLVRHENQYEALLESILPRYQCEKWRLEFFLAHRARAFALYPAVSVSIPVKTPCRNIIVNPTAKILLGRFVTKAEHLPVWLTEGFGYCMEAVHAERPRAVVPEGWREQTGPHVAADSRRWEHWVRASVRDGSAQTFAKLKHVLLQEFDESTAARSWSLVEFLMEKHPKKFVRWMRLLSEKRWQERFSWQGAFFEVFQWQDTDVDRAWQLWVAGQDEMTSQPSGR